MAFIVHNRSVMALSTDKEVLHRPIGIGLALGLYIGWFCATRKEEQQRHGSKCWGTGSFNFPTLRPTDSSKFPTAKLLLYKISRTFF